MDFLPSGSFIFGKQSINCANGKPRVFKLPTCILIALCRVRLDSLALAWASRYLAASRVKSVAAIDGAREPIAAWYSRSRVDSNCQQKSTNYNKKNKKSI